MIESYQTEVAKKRKAARIFWFLVFFFATFLYFFFQGYYPDVRLGLKRILSESGTTSTGNTDLIKSFGIINISVKSPADATIFLSSGSYINNEKRMTSYGTYSASVSRWWYVTDVFDFVIDRETPYYISQITLLRDPQYRELGTGSIENIAKISDTLWIESNGSGHIMRDATFSGTVGTLSGRYTHIGEWHFLSGSYIYTHNSEDTNWERKIWSGSIAFLRDCEEGIRIKSGVIFCEENKTLLTQKWKTLTGILSVENNYIKKSDSILIGDAFTKMSLTGAELESPGFLEKDGNWYSQSGWTLVALKSNINKKLILPIITPLDTIEYMDWIDGELILIGKKSDKKYLVRMNTEGVSREPIAFPDIELRDIRIVKNNGNLFIKTRTAIVFLYNDSRDIKWLIDGEILAFSELGAIYRKDWVLWHADWNNAE
jgi:hypothetical protein